MFTRALHLFAQTSTDDSLVPPDSTFTSDPVTTTTGPSDAELNSAAAAAGTSMLIFFVIFIVFYLLNSFILSKIFKKAGEAGWQAYVPILNSIVLLRIVGRPVWWVILFFIPFVSLVVAIISLHDLSKSFGRGVGMTILNILVPIVGLAILAFGSDEYKGPSAGPNAGVAPNGPAGSSPAAPYANNPASPNPTAPGVAAGAATPFAAQAPSPQSFGPSPVADNNPQTEAAPIAQAPVDPIPVTSPTVETPAVQSDTPPAVAAAPENPVQLPASPVQDNTFAPTQPQDVQPTQPDSPYVQPAPQPEQSQDQNQQFPPQNPQNQA